jgi:hypothetical protein
MERDVRPTRSIDTARLADRGRIAATPSISQERAHRHFLEWTRPFQLEWHADGAVRPVARDSGRVHDALSRPAIARLRPWREGFVIDIGVET